MTAARDARGTAQARSSGFAGGAIHGAKSAGFAPLIVLALGALCVSGAAQARNAHASRASHAPAASPRMVSYVTHPGDTLYDFAGRYLRNPADWTQLARINAVAAPRRLRPGTVLRVPVALLRQDGLGAKVIATSGPATHAFRNGPDLPLIVGATLVEGDRLQTGANGFATLEMADGTHLVIPPESSLDFGTLRQTALTGVTDRIVNLHRGEVDSEVTHATRPDDRFQIRSPSVVAGVRGTSFRVNHDETSGATAVEVLEGAVGVDPLAAVPPPAPGMPLKASTQLVPAHYGSVTREGGSIGELVALLDAPTLKNAAKVQDDAEVAFDLAPVDGARRYRARIGRDADLLDEIRDIRSDDPHVVVGALDDGTYFIRLTAIDANGLEGMPRTYAFERRRMALGASAGPEGGSRNYVFRWFVDRSADTTRFRFVLAADRDLKVPLVDRPDLKDGQVVVRDLGRGVYYWTVIAEQFDHGRYYQKASPVKSFQLDQ